MKRRNYVIFIYRLMQREHKEIRQDFLFTVCVCVCVKRGFFKYNEDQIERKREDFFWKDE